jgi:PAS domain S-box-containing protein
LEVKRLSQALNDLRARYDLLQRVTESIDSVFWVSDPQSARLLYVSPAYERIWQRPLERLYQDSKAWIEAIHSEDVDAVLDSFRRQAAGEATVVEFRILLPDATVRRIENRGFPVKDARGAVIQTTGVATDITELRESQDALRETNERLEATLNTLPDLLFEVGRDGRFHAFRTPDPAMLYADDFIGKTVDEVLPADAAERAMQGLEEAARTGRHVGTTYALDVAGGTHWFELSIAAKGDPSAADARFIVLARDISERRRWEAQFQHTQKLESLGVMAGGIAHDFNNLLVGVLGNAELALANLPPASPARDDIQDIRIAAQRAADLASQMLAYSGSSRIASEPIELSSLVREMTHLLEASISKKVALRYDLAEGPTPIEGDPTQLRQVVMNLITNASEAIGERGGLISISTGEMHCDRTLLDTSYVDDRLDEGPYVYLEVMDTGCGMDHKTVARMFDPFFTTKFAGRGLGLAALLGIVRSHKGAIMVDSEPGTGTTVRVVLPQSERTAEAPSAGAADPLQWQASGTVLLVDDEEMIRSTTGKMISYMGFELLTASDGAEAVEVFREHADVITLVVLDMKMPHMSGAEAFEEIRRIKPDAEVILCSGYTEEEATQRFVGSGLAGFLQKPYTMDQLVTAIRSVLA